MNSQSWVTNTLNILRGPFAGAEKVGQKALEAIIPDPVEDSESEEEGENVAQVNDPPVASVLEPDEGALHLPIQESQPTSKFANLKLFNKKDKPELAVIEDLAKHISYLRKDVSVLQHELAKSTEYKVPCIQSMIEIPSFQETSSFDMKTLAGCKVIDFYFKHIRFNGKDGKEEGNINDFLRNMLVANESARLNREDFITVLISKTSGPARNVFESWKSMDCTVEEIYSAAYSTWNSEVSATKAGALLANYSIPKSFTFSEAIADINQLAILASCSGIDKAARLHLQESHIINTLLNRLPKNVRHIIETEYIKLQSRLGRQPLAKELLSCLYAYHSRINEELGVCKEYNYSGKRGVFDICKEKKVVDFDRTNTFKFKKGVRNLNVNALSYSDAPQSSVSSKTRENKTSEKLCLMSQLHPKLSSAHINALDKSMKFNTKNQQGKGKKYCTFCGMNNHNSSDGCYSIRNDELRNVYVTPSMQECGFCSEKLNKNLHHSSKLCPIRSTMMTAYKKGLVKPLGFFKAYFEKQNPQSK